MKHKEHIYQMNRRKTKTVLVGNIGIGSNHPIRIQSMTTSDTKDVIKTAEQIMKLADSGCELARITVQGKVEALACEKIKNHLLQKNYTIPLVADIHFYPPAAMLVADFVEKIRINPGNFADRRASFKIIEYTNETYRREIDRITEVFSPLVEKCLKNKKAIRIGTNHGSLSDRIMNRYGDTPAGMVESAIEYAKICRSLDFHNFLFSMKASNPIVMIEAYRLLTTKMDELGWDYPLHLGVTEAGDGEDGRVKSAVGIGTLLLDGLGDTIRVSLTEDPWHEIKPCQQLRSLSEESKLVSFPIETKIVSKKRNIQTKISNIFHRDGTIIVNDEYSNEKADGIYSADKNEITFNEKKVKVVPLKDFKNEEALVYVRDGNPAQWENLKNKNLLGIFAEFTESKLYQGRYFFDWLKKENINVPVILTATYKENKDEVIIKASAELGSLLSDGLGDGIFLKADFDSCDLAFNILQGCRMRATKTEFIACPSCGRTLFNLQEVTQKIRARTSHLPGVKIAIMGCIVNGPGEMADADFGYVGSGPENIDLYVGKEKVKKSIHYTKAVDSLIELIKEHDRWIEPDYSGKEMHR